MSESIKILQFKEGGKAALSLHLKKSKDGSAYIIPLPNSSGAHMSIHRSGITNIGSNIKKYYNVNFQQLAASSDIVGSFKRRRISLRNMKQMIVWPKLASNENSNIVDVSAQKAHMENNQIIHNIRNVVRLRRLQKKYPNAKYVFLYLSKDNIPVMPINNDYGIATDNKFLEELKKTKLFEVLSTFD